MRFLRKIIPYHDLKEWREGLSLEQRPLVATNGCFDCLHVGHVRLLQSAQAFGKTLLVGVTNDKGIRQLKGPSRPVTQENDRLAILAALEMVDYVCLFPETDATTFLQKARPDIYVKGADYTIDTINQRERMVLMDLGCEIKFIPRLDERSSTAFISRIQNGTPATNIQ